MIGALGRRTVAGCLGVAAVLFGASATTASATPAGGSPVATVLVSGAQLSHPLGGRLVPLSKPDDVVVFHRHLFVAFQNGVGSMGEPSPTGNTASTLVELATDGHPVRQWDLAGKVDGLGIDKRTGEVVATVNEDGNSSLYTIAANGLVVHYAYNEDPLPHGGGTDAVSFDHGDLLVSASAPTVADGPAVYRVRLQRPTSAGGIGTAVVSPLFADNASATPADPGAPSQLALTDPDSNTVVARSSPRFGGEFMLDSQGDQQQVYVSDVRATTPTLAVLALTQSVDDTAFVTDPDGTLYATDNTDNTVNAIRGRFQRGEAFVAVTPCGADNAPATCPAPGFPANYLGQLDLSNGAISAVNVGGATLEPQGMVFVSDHQGR